MVARDTQRARRRLPDLRATRERTIVPITVQMTVQNRRKIFTPPSLRGCAGVKALVGVQVVRGVFLCVRTVRPPAVVGRGVDPTPGCTPGPSGPVACRGRTAGSRGASSGARDKADGKKGAVAGWRLPAQDRRKVRKAGGFHAGARRVHRRNGLHGLLAGSSHARCATSNECASQQPCH